MYMYLQVVCFVGNTMETFVPDISHNAAVGTMHALTDEDRARLACPNLTRSTRANAEGTRGMAREVAVPKPTRLTQTVGSRRAGAHMVARASCSYC